MKYLSILLLLLSANASANLVRFEVGSSVYDLDGNPAGYTEIGFTVDPENHRTTDWSMTAFKTDEEGYIGQNGSADLSWETYLCNPECGAWVSSGPIHFDNGFTAMLFESWMAYLGDDLSPYETMALVNGFTFRMHFGYEGESYRSIEERVEKYAVSDPAEVPEPYTFALLGLGLLGIGLKRRLS